MAFSQLGETGSPDPDLKAGVFTAPQLLALVFATAARCEHGLLQKEWAILVPCHRWLRLRGVAYL